MKETYSKLTIKTPEHRKWSRFGVFIVMFELISHSAYSAEFEQVNGSWVLSFKILLCLVPSNKPIMIHLQNEESQQWI